MIETQVTRSHMHTELNTFKNKYLGTHRENEALNKFTGTHTMEEPFVKMLNLHLHICKIKK